MRPPLRFRFQMKPEWNRSQQVLVGNRMLTVSAAPFDTPSAFQVETSNGQVVVTCMYDFNADEPTELAIESKRVRILRGKTSGRLMRFLIEADGLQEAELAIRELAKDLEEYANRSKTDVRRSVHIGMFGQALPEMGMFIEGKLRELRASP